MIATLIGGTGLTGSALAQKLLADATITRVISISRKSLNITDAKFNEVLVADLSSLPSIESQIRGDLYFCCLGTTIMAAGSKANFEKVDQHAVVAFAKIAKVCNAKSFTMVSSMGASAASRIFYNQVKGRTEADVIAIGLQSLTIFRPGLLVGPRQEFRLTEKLATVVLVPFARFLPARTRKSLLTVVDTLAMRMLEEGKAARGGVHVISSKDI